MSDYSLILTNPRKKRHAAWMWFWENPPRFYATADFASFQLVAEELMNRIDLVYGLPGMDAELARYVEIACEFINAATWEGIYVA